MGIFDFLKKKKVTPSASARNETREDFFRAMRNPSANKDTMKNEIFRQILEAMANQTPSDQFASGAVFDITRQQHNVYERIVRSNNALELHQFFANAYAQFCNNPEIVGFAPTMVNKDKNDTDPMRWNADIVSFDNGDAVGMCFMPVQSSDHAARIVGIVIGSKGDGYYYCMLNKDESLASEVKRNKALAGVATVGAVKGRGPELMNCFIDCIMDNYYS